MNVIKKYTFSPVKWAESPRDYMCWMENEDHPVRLGSWLSDSHICEICCAAGFRSMWFTVSEFCVLQIFKHRRGAIVFRWISTRK